MSELDVWRNPRLFGAIDTPLIPPSWMIGASWAVSHAALFGGARKQAVMTNVELATNPLGAKQVAVINWLLAARLVGEAHFEANPEWLAAPLVGTSVGLANQSPVLFELDGQQLILATDPLSAIKLGEIPLMVETVSALRMLHFNSDVPLDVVGRTPRGRIAEQESGWLALLDLSTLLECWLPFRALSPIAAVQESASTLEHVATALVREYIALDGYRLDERWPHFVCRRFSWGVPKATLEEIGRDAGVTRERVRQIMARLESQVGKRRWPMPRVLASAIEAISDNEFRDVQATLLEAGLATDDDWTPEELVLLIRWFGFQEAADRLSESFSSIEVAGADPENLRALRAARAGMGLLRIDSVLAADGETLDIEIVRQVARNSYTNLSEANGWVLLGDGRGTMLESSAAKQFFVSPELEAHELYDGLQRVQRNRKAPPLPPIDTTLELLCAAGTATQTTRGTFTGTGTPLEKGSLLEWLYFQLLAAEGRVLHKETLNRAALLEGRNLSSLQLYFTYSPIVRLAESGSGLIRLVGANPSLRQMQFARDVAAAQHVTTTMDWRVSYTGIAMDVGVGGAFLTSGVLGIQTALGRIWPSSGVFMSCLCDRQFGGRISLHSDTSLYGWAPLIHHLALDHGVREGTQLSLQLSDDLLRLVAIS